jgi:hypothetical protein
MVEIIGRAQLRARASGIYTTWMRPPSAAVGRSPWLDWLGAVS